VNCEDVNLSLPSRDCPKNGGGGRNPNAKEEFILYEWRKKGFSEHDIKPGWWFRFGNL